MSRSEYTPPTPIASPEEIETAVDAYLTANPPAVDSVNGSTGAVVLDAEDVGATAVEVSVVTGVGPLLLASTAVDGTATTVTVIRPSPGADASGAVPAGYEAVATVPVAVADFVTPDRSILCVPGGTGCGLYRWNTGAMASAWEEIPSPDGRVAFYYFDAGAVTYQWSAARSGAAFAPLQAELRAQPYVGKGLLSGVDWADPALDALEGIADTEHWVGAYFDTTVIDPTDYDTAPVSQPTPDGGIIAPGVDVLVLTAADTTKRGLWHVSEVDETWSQLGYPDILIGNSFTVMVNAEGDADDGVHFEWIDEDPTIPKRRSTGYPGSSDGHADGRNGRWLKYPGPTAVI